MHDEILVSELHCLANSQEYGQALRFGEALRVTESMNRDSIHVFHDQIQVPFSADPAIEQPGNEGMLQSGQNLPFQAKSLAQDVRSQGQVDELDRNLLFEVSIGAMSQIHGPHTSAPKQPVHLVGPDSLSLGSAA